MSGKIKKFIQEYLGLLAICWFFILLNNKVTWKRLLTMALIALPITAVLFFSGIGEKIKARPPGRL